MVQIPISLSKRERGVGIRLSVDILYIRVGHGVSVASYEDKGLPQRRITNRTLARIPSDAYSKPTQPPAAAGCSTQAVCSTYVHYYVRHIQHGSIACYARRKVHCVLCKKKGALCVQRKYKERSIVGDTCMLYDTSWIAHTDDAICMRSRIVYEVTHHV